MRKKQFFYKMFISFLLIFIAYACEKSINEDLNVNSEESFIIESDIAEQIAGFLDIDSLAGLKLKTKVDREIADISVVTSDDGIADFYIVNFKDEKGFITISADKRVIPILAFSNKGSFYVDEQEGSGVEIWVSNNKKYIKGIRNGKFESEAEVEELWGYLDAGLPVPIEPGDPGDGGEPGGGNTDPNIISTTSRGELLATQWSQGCDFNDFCPPQDNDFCNHSPTGCGATAMAQIMKYYRHPSSYDWDLMPFGYGSPETAQLMKDIGDKTGMEYGRFGSSIPIDEIEFNIVDAFENDFGYSTTTRYVDYTNDYSLLINELNYYRPVIFKGLRTSIIGHIWVCDGYIKTVYTTFTTLYFHMNWGWKFGSSNGWFAPNHFDPVLNGTQVDYGNDLGCIIGIKP